MITNYEIPGHGYYLMIGAFDAEEGRVPQILLDDLAQYQSSYNDGYAQGLWIDYMTKNTTM